MNHLKLFSMILNLCLLTVAGGVLQSADVHGSGVFPNGRFDPALSPDGAHVAYALKDGGGGSDIYVEKLCYWPLVSCKGRQEPPLRLTTHKAADFSPAWSPDGQHIAFCRQTAAGTTIFLVASKGGLERRIGESKARRPSLAWSPDGKSLVVPDKVSTGESLFALSVLNGNRQRLTVPPPEASGDGTPAISPDGKFLAFSRKLKSGPATIQIQSLGSGVTASGQPRRLNAVIEPGKAKGAISGLAWSSDGASIVFASGGLWKVSSSGGKAERLAESEGEIQSLSASRQGRRVVYSELVPEVEIWRTAGPASRPQDFPPTRLIGSPDDVGSPNISRDGKKIAFGSFMSGTWEIWKCDSDGKNPVQLSFLGDVPTGSPRWSPDGKYVVFDGRGEDGLLNDIYVVDGNGGTARRLTKEPSADIRPCFSKDQRWIFFTSNRTGTFQIWKVPTEGGKAVQVTQNGGLIGFETLDGKYLYYGKGRGQTTLWRVPSGGGEEVKVLDDVNPSNFAVCESGVIILNLAAKPRSAIEFYSFATQKRTRLSVLPKEGKVIGSGTSISVAPDGRWLVYHQEGALASSLRARDY